VGAREDGARWGLVVRTEPGGGSLCGRSQVGARCADGARWGLVVQCYHAKENLASAKIVKIQFNVNLGVLGFPHFITFKECRKVL